jgi:hypothetical protein
VLFVATTRQPSGERSKLRIGQSLRKPLDGAMGAVGSSQGFDEPSTGAEETAEAPGDASEIADTVPVALSLDDALAAPLEGFTASPHPFVSKATTAVENTRRNLIRLPKMARPIRFGFRASYQSLVVHSPQLITVRSSEARSAAVDADPD